MFACPLFNLDINNYLRSNENNNSLCCILFAVVGCAQFPLSKVQQEVDNQVKLLVDSGHIQNKCVVLFVCHQAHLNFMLL